MIADIHITEKSFGDKTLMRDVKFSVDDGEKVGVVGRNGVGKSTLFGILAGTDTDYTGEVIFRRGITVASTAQEHHGLGDQTVLSYILAGLPEYAALKKIIDEYPETMGDNMRKIEEYTQALERFDQKGFYQIEEKIGRELDNFQLSGCGERPLGSLSGGQKRLVEIVKIMHAGAHLALIDEPTNHMDYVAKQQFIDWMSSQPRQAMLIITHDRDVLGRVDRIIELKDGRVVSYRGNYDAYLKQNAQATAAGMNNFEQIEKRMTNLRQKVLDYQRLKEKSRNPGTIQKFKRLENEARAELAELSEMDKPTFWIDKESAGQLDYKSAERYGKFKARNIRLSMKDAASRSQHVLVRVEDAAVGVGGRILFEGVNIDLREGEAVELRGRNGAGKTTLIRMLLASGGVAARASHKTIRDPLKPAQIFSETPLAPDTPAAAPPALEAVEHSRIASAPAERSRSISSGDLSEKSTPEKERGAGDANFADGVRGVSETTHKEYSEEVKIPVADLKQELIKLLNYHLNLFDHYQPTLGRPFETLKRFFKIYIRDFDGAKELRDQLMHTKNTSEVRQILEKIQCL